MPNAKAVTLANPSVPVEVIERKIYSIRKQKVMLDADLAELYEVLAKVLNQAVKRNADRFPKDFMFRLSLRENAALNRSQIVTSSQKHRNPRSTPLAFTELGVAMLSSVLNSKRAVQMNIQIMRAFVKLREVMATHVDLAARMKHVEAVQEKHGKVITSVVEEIKQMKALPPPPKRKYGFKTDLASA